MDISAPKQNISNDEEKDEKERLFEEPEYLLHEKESKAIQSVLNAGPIASKNATPLFFLATIKNFRETFTPADGYHQRFLKHESTCSAIRERKRCQRCHSRWFGYFFDQRGSEEGVQIRLQ